MKQDRILNPELIRLIAAIGHTQTLVIADAGLPVPKGVGRLQFEVQHPKQKETICKPSCKM